MTTRAALMVFAAVLLVSVGVAVGMVFLVAWISPETVQGVICAHQYETTTPNGVTYRVCVRTP